MKKILLLFCFLAFPAISFAHSALEESPIFQELWRSLNMLSEQAAGMAILPERNKKTFLQNLLGHNSSYGRMLKEARDTLTRGTADAIFSAIDKLMYANEGLKKKIATLKRERIGAPLESSNPFAKTKKSIDEEINIKIPREIQSNSEEIENLKKEAISELHKNGINLEPYQLEYFLVSAEGEELLKLMTMASNMKALQEVIEEQMRVDKGTIELARQYTGMHLVSLDAYASAHDKAIENLTEYRKRLGPIMDEAQKTIDEAKKLMSRAKPEERRGLESNIKINMRIISVAQAYGHILDRRIKNLTESKEKVCYKADVSRNAYTTIVNGGNLINIIQKGDKDYDLVLNFSMPELRTIYEPIMMDAFTEISLKIKNKS